MYPDCTELTNVKGARQACRADGNGEGAGMRGEGWGVWAMTAKVGDS